MTTYFVIRHKPTGTLLPARVMATHFGFSSSEEVTEPRLFGSERAAKNCATLWAQGVWTRKTYTESEGWEYPSYTCFAEPAPMPMPHRQRDHLEVVEVKLEMLVKPEIIPTT